jgi:hypothetical protein
MRGQGAFVQPDRFQVSFEAEGQRFEQILIGQTIYSRSSTDADWRTIDSPAMLRRERGSLPPGSEQALLDALSTFQEIGSETLDGAATRHYGGDVDLLALIPAVSGDATAREAFEAFKMRLEFWIGIDDRYLHQVKAALEVRGRSTRTDVPNSLTADIGLTFFDFEQAISIEPPIGQPGLIAGPRPAPAQAPAQVPARTPARLPATGQGSAGPLPPMILGWALLGLGMRLRRAAESRRTTRARDAA